MPRWRWGTTGFDPAGAPKLFPADLAQQIEDINGWVYDDVANGAYKAGFAKSQVLKLTPRFNSAKAGCGV